MSSSNQPSAPSGGNYTITTGGVTYSASYGTSPQTGGLGSFTVCSDSISGATLAAPAVPTMVLSVVAEEPVITFKEQQPDGTVVKAVLEPDASMTARDLVKVTTLITVVQYGAGAKAGSPLKPITYIRKHSLERHFRFSSE